MTPCRSTPLALVFFVLALALLAPGCSPGFKEKAGISGHRETYYFDAELAFTIEYPSGWKLERGKGREPESCTVRWQSPPVQGSPEPVARAMVVACPAFRWPGGFEEMRAEFLGSHPDLTLTREEEAELPGGKGHSLEGHDSSRTYLAVFLHSQNRGYIVAFSTPGGDFESYRPLFEDMLESFHPLDGR